MQQWNIFIAFFPLYTSILTTKSSSPTITNSCMVLECNCISSFHQIWSPPAVFPGSSRPKVDNISHRKLFFQTNASWKSPSETHKDWRKWHLVRMGTVRWHFDEHGFYLSVAYLRMVLCGVRADAHSLTPALCFIGLTLSPWRTTFTQESHQSIIRPWCTFSSHL